VGKYTIMAIAWIVVAVWIGGVLYSNRKVHPKALFLLFFAEFWERFSYYGMRALLVLYMVKQLKYADGDAYGVYAAYGAMVYATPILGGLIANKLFGYRSSIMIGGALMAAGHFTMALLGLWEHDYVFFLALALLIIGNGYFKPNISSFIAEFYEKNDVRKDSAYTLFYMGIYAGAMLTPLTCGVIGEDTATFGVHSWHYGFGLAGIGMMVGLGVFVWGQATGVFEDKGFAPDKEKLTAKTAGLPNNVGIGLLTVLALPVVMVLINFNAVLDVGLAVLIGGVLIGLAIYGGKMEDREDGQRLWVIVVLLLFTTLFWTFFELAGSAISLYTDRNVDRHVMGAELSTSMFQAVNPAFIIILAPAFSGLWKFLADRKIEPSAPIKFAIGLGLLGAGFIAFKVGEPGASAGLVTVWWLILAYLLHTLGELCLSPVGLSLVTKLAPTRIVGLMMGIWFLSSSAAHQLGAIIARFTAPVDKTITDPTITLPIYTGVFFNVGLTALGASVLLFLLSPIIKKWMHGIK
jgi:POT family proton-dependent oligopeptide transporter